MGYAEALELLTGAAYGACAWYLWTGRKEGRVASEFWRAYLIGVVALWSVFHVALVVSPPSEWYLRGRNVSTLLHVPTVGMLWTMGLLWRRHK